MWERSNLSVNDALLNGLKINAQAPVRWMFVGACLTGLLLWGNPPLALLAGLLLAFTIGSPIGDRAQTISKWLLQSCVVCLGFGMNLPTVLRAGWDGAVFSAISIAGSLLVGHWIGRWIGVNRQTSTLISAGTAICGGSAIAAVGSVMAVSGGELAVAIGTVFILNAIALYLFPAIGHALSLSQHQFGLWAGIAIHDISSVVGASLSYGQESLNTATAVKLSRTLWIIPLTTGIRLASAFCKNVPCSGREPASKRFAIPWFIAGFLLASVLSSYIPWIGNRTGAISSLAHAGFIVVLFLIGTSIQPSLLRTLGWRACAQGIILWVLVSSGSLFAILACHL